jgi:hypothetical protein
MIDKARKDGRFRFVDLLVILLCLSGAAYSINLFRLDLFRTLDPKNEKPVGVIIIKNNIVQRRMENRVLWDRLAVDSPAYEGDLIRTADISAASLNIENNSINIDENTLIRIQRSPEGEDAFQIELRDGNIGLTTVAGGGSIVLNLMGRQVEVAPGTILSASAGKDGGTVKVSEGSAAFISDGQRREITSGTMIALDSNGEERAEKSAVVIQPHSGIRYLKNDSEPMQVNFTWNRINLDSGEPLRLEIAEDRKFKRITHVIDNLDTDAGVELDAGLWYWRLSSMQAANVDAVLSSGRLTLADAAGPDLLSPAMDSLFHYRNSLPQLRFQWSEIPEASSYILEAAQTPDFINPLLRLQTASIFLIDSSLGPGTWYWRVVPVFPSIYEGQGNFSSASSFRIEQGDTEALVMPEPPVVQPVPVKLSLLSPAPETALPGLTALRQQTVFTWDSDGEIISSRFILSRNSDPLQGRPVTEINNPDRTVRLNRLGEGVYYWTVEAQSADGLISAAVPRQLRILQIPLLSIPENRRPAPEYRIGIEQLRESESIVFTWSAVQGANAYIFTLYENTGAGRRRIINAPPQTRTNWMLENLAVLGRGTFNWQVEAVNRNSAGTIEQRGRVGENSFIIDIPRPGRVQVEDPGTLYGF